MIKVEDANIYLVAWVDAAATMAAWTSPEDLPKPALVHSVGWMVKDNSDYITLTLSIPHDHEGNPEYGPALTIPRGMIKNIIPLSTPPEQADFMSSYDQH